MVVDFLTHASPHHSSSFSHDLRRYKNELGNSGNRTMRYYRDSSNSHRYRNNNNNDNNNNNNENINENNNNDDNNSNHSEEGELVVEMEEVP